jgi:hypothetical protein
VLKKAGQQNWTIGSKMEPKLRISDNSLSSSILGKDLRGYIYYLQNNLDRRCCCRENGLKKSIHG